MKIVLTTTTTLVLLLTIGLLGINNNNSNNIDNAFAQEGAITHEGMNNTMGNDTSMMMNATLPTSIISNITLAYAQDTGMMEGMDEEGMMTTMSSNQSEGMKMMKLNGTIDVEKTIAEAFKSKVTTDIIGAIQAAQASVGANSFVKEAELTHAHGYLVYKILVVDENLKKYKVIVDPGNGQVLIKKDVTGYYDEHEKKEYYEEKGEKFGKYGGHGYDDYDDKKKMMMMEDDKYK